MTVKTLKPLTSDQISMLQLMQENISIINIDQRPRSIMFFGTRLYEGGIMSLQGQDRPVWRIEGISNDGLLFLNSETCIPSFLSWWRLSAASSVWRRAATHGWLYCN